MRSKEWLEETKKVNNWNENVRARDGSNRISNESFQQYDDDNDDEAAHRHSRAPFAWVTSDYVTSVPCRISRLPTALSRCWDNGSIRMDHDPGLDVPGTLEINASIMIPTVLFHRRAIEGNNLFLVHLPCDQWIFGNRKWELHIDRLAFRLLRS